MSGFQYTVRDEKQIYNVGKWYEYINTAVKTQTTMV